MTQSATNGNSTNIIVDPKVDMTLTGAPYGVDSLSVNGDILSIFVNYGGGCKEHDFELYSSGMYAKSLPMQVGVCLKHKNNGDACRKLIFRELKFNIAKLKVAGNKSLIVKLDNRQVNYKAK